MKVAMRTLCLAGLLIGGCAQLTDDEGVLALDPAKETRPDISVTPGQLHVTCRPGDAALPLLRAFGVRNSGDQGLQVHVRSGTPWLAVVDVDTQLGVGSGQELSVHLRMPMQVLALTSGQPLRGLVRVEAAGCRPESVEVFLTVSDSGATQKEVRVEPHALLLDQWRGAPGASKVARVFWVSGATFAAGVDPGAPWLAVDPPSLNITAGDTAPQLVTLRVKADSLPPGDTLMTVLRVLPDGGSPGSDSVVVVVHAWPGPEGMRRIGAAGDTMFRMGSTYMGNEQPVHPVSFSRDFWVDTTEVTEGLYQDIVGLNPVPSPRGPRMPVTMVTWYDAAFFCNRRSRAAGLDTVYDYTGVQGTAGSGCVLTGLTSHLQRTGFRLPSEAQWEYACCARTRSAFYWGDLMLPDTLAKYMWYDGNSGDMAHPVATKAPNAFGLFDMSANVWEWCQDRWQADYGSAAPLTDPVVFTLPSDPAVLRGGAYNSITMAGNPSPAEYRSAYRDSDTPDGRWASVGFRTVLPAGGP